jgi:hypothetical protein
VHVYVKFLLIIATLEAGEEEKRSRGTLVTQLAASGQLLGLLQLIKSAHSNYKVTLEAAASAKLVALLAATLEALGRMLEAATVTEVGRLAEELLHHLKITAALAPAHTVHAVQQVSVAVLILSCSNCRLHLSSSIFRVFSMSPLPNLFSYAQGVGCCPFPAQGALSFNINKWDFFLVTPLPP